VAARAVGDAGTICCLSTLTGTALEEVRAASAGPCWFQLYLVGGREVAERAIARAKAAGYDALVLTIDTPVAGMRLRDQRNGSSQLISGSVWQKAKFVPMMMRHLSWLTSFYADGGLMQFPNIELQDGAPMPYADIGRQLQQSAVTWDDIAWIRAAWGGPLVVKGVHNLEDARQAQNHGAQAIVISNHGGRQLDRALPTLHILRRVAPAMKDCGMDILMDGGVRSGGDVVLALASGAKAVQVGRAYAYGLGAGGEAGVRRAFAILRDDLEHTMRQLGCGSIAEINASHYADYPFE
jgi:L-lactate dehydrogenase (cytochrome)